MPWQLLSSRINDLPLILAGPILRRVEPGAVTVWVALKERKAVTLKVYESNQGNPGNARLEGARTTVQLGTNLHVVAVTAKPQLPGGSPLAWGSLYLYNLFFNDPLAPGTGPDLFGPKVLVLASEPNASDAARYAATKLLTYYLDADDSPRPGMPTLPSFVLPPEDLNKLRIIHGSCRKPDSEGKDALAGLDVMIEKAAKDPTARPQQLFLTGDQIYADGVADTLLTLLSDAGDTLLGGEETLPGLDDVPIPKEKLAAGRRHEIAHKVAGLTSGYNMKSHLFKVGEFYSMYLFVWSEVLWPPTLPQFKDVYVPENQEREAFTEAGQPVSGGSPIPPFENLYSKFNESRDHVQELRRTLPAVRRALANIPTYMIFDDHEVSDDWYQDFDWNIRVLKRPLGKRVIQNALLTYAIFQAWGNTPDRFEGATYGSELLKRAEKWSSPSGFTVTDSDAIAEYLGVPKPADVKKYRQLRLPQPLPPSKALHWHYTVNGPKYQVIVLDTRTWRGYPGAPIDPPALISDDAFDLQIPQTTKDEADKIELYLIVSPVPVIMIPLDEWGQKSLVTVAKRSGREWIARVADPEGWALQSVTFESLLAKLASRLTVLANGEKRARIVFLSGDVHRGYAARFQYWATTPFTLPGSEPAHVATEPTNIVFAQLTSSGLKNEAAFPQHFFHNMGYRPGNALPPSYQWAGWNIPPGLKDITIGAQYKREYEGESWEPYKLRKVPALFRFSPTPVEVVSISKEEDWLYRIDFILGEHINRDFTPEILSSPATPQPSGWLELERQAGKAHRYYARKWANGKEIVGFNNIGEITFQWGEDDDDKTLTQELWWRLTKEGNLLPLTKYIVSLRLYDLTYSKPGLPGL